MLLKNMVVDLNQRSRAINLITNGHTNWLYNNYKINISYKLIKIIHGTGD